MGRFHHHPDTGDDHDHSHEHDRDVGDHGGYATRDLRVEVLQEILGENDRTADANRDDFRRSGVSAVNVMSSPGAGKTTLLRRVFLELGATLRAGVVEGDIETAHDADLLAETGVPVSLINTANGFGGECHLDATMVRSALPRLPLDELDLVVIENVGNLVCPAEFDVGEDARAMVFSVTEGEEKPLKYPVMFRTADLVLLTKVDLLPHLPQIDVAAIEDGLARTMPEPNVIHVSAITDEGMDRWIQWLEAKRTAALTEVAAKA